MTWNTVLRQLDELGVVEFGIHQMNAKTGSPIWRRHKGGSPFRFKSIRSALFSPDKGARAACLGNSDYAISRYSAGSTSVIPYAATWLKGSDIALLARAGATEPEVTLVPVRELESIRGTSHTQLLTNLATLFGEGAKEHGVRHLLNGAIDTAV